MLELSKDSWGTILRTLRTNRGFSATGLAAKSNVNLHTISRIERDAIIPSEPTKAKLAKALGVKVADLFPYDVPPGGDAA